MFAVIALQICLANAPIPTCGFINDLHGPYETMERCEQRLDELMDKSTRTIESYTYKAFCAQLDDEGNPIGPLEQYIRGDDKIYEPPAPATPVGYEGTTAIPVQMACGTRDAVVAKLGEKYGEVRRGGGLAGPTAIYEIWASEATGTWTILKSTTDGMACIMAVGDGWQDDTREPAPVGDPV